MKPPFPSGFPMPSTRARAIRLHHSQFSAPMSCHRPGVVNPPPGRMALATGRCVRLVCQRLRAILGTASA